MSIRYLKILLVVFVGLSGWLLVAGNIAMPMAIKIHQGENCSAVMQASGVWQSKKASVNHALREHSPTELEKMLQHGKFIDQSIKGLHKGNPWHELETLVLKLSGLNIAIA